MDKLLKITQSKTDILKIFNIISLCFGLIAFIICLGLYFEHYGFDKGLLIGEDRYQNLLSGMNFSFGIGPRTYEFFANKYKCIAWFLMIFLIGKLLETGVSYKFLKTKIISQIICFFSVALSLYQLRELLYGKFYRSQNGTWNEPFDTILRNSVPFDWLCLFIVLVLLIIQIIDSFIYHYDKNRKIV